MKNLTIQKGKEIRRYFLSSLRSKIRVFLVVFMLSGSTLNAGITRNVTTAAAADTRLMEIRARVDVIKAMEFEEMSGEDRKSIKTELKGMNKELKQMHPTFIYISGGGLLLIIILLIIFL